MDLLGRYEIVREVSRGARATVLQAIDRAHGQVVALKIYEVTDTDELSRLRSEARVLLGLKPHAALPVVRVDFVTGDQYVIVMDWVDGTDAQTLLDEAEGAGLPLGTVIDIVGQVAAALDHLHGHDPPVVHGDVKPANLVRRADGSIVLVDFGMAAESGTARIGTRGFVAPEVAGGEKPGREADVFGLAATAVALLTGAPPSGADVVPSDLGPTIGSAVARTLRRALSTDPARRPASAGELADAIREGRVPALPSGVVTIVSIEFADAAAFWHEHPGEMRAVSARLGDLVAEVVERAGGRFASTAGEGDRAVAVFQRASAAALAALDLHERVDAESWPRGVRVALRVGLEVGEADVRNGALQGAVLEKAAWMRSVAAPGSTITSRTTADLLRERIDDEVSIIPFGEFTPRDGAQAQLLFAVATPGEEPLPVPANRVSPATPAVVPTAEVELVPVVAPTPARRIVGDVVQAPMTLGALTVCGLAVVYLVVLAPVLGLGGLALLLAVISGSVGVVTTVVGTRAALSADRERVAGEVAQREIAALHSSRLEETERARRALTEGFAAIGAADAQHVLDDMVDAYETLQQSTRLEDARGAGVAYLIPRLADETYAQGLSALSDALEGLSVSNDREMRRIGAALDDARARQSEPIEDRATPSYDTRRIAMYTERLDRLRQVRDLAEELLFQAERCGEVLRDARIEMAAMRIGTTESRVDAVVETIQSNLDRVREVQEAFRRLER